MAGHSKWANIRHRKGAQDAKRGKIFTKLIKEISVAARISGPDPDSNPRLRIAIQNAKGKNVPKDNIERAIKKASGDDATNYTEVTYEGYAPHGVAVFVECATDNLKRTIASVRSIFTKNGGSLATNGSVSFMFDSKGIFLLNKPEAFDIEEFEMSMIDAGAEDFEVNEDLISVTSAKEDYGNVQKALDELEVAVEESGLQMIPQTTVERTDDEVKSILKLIDKLEDDDDIQKVYHNLEITESQLEFI